MPCGPSRWWALWWSCANDDATKFAAVRRQPIYRLWWITERRIAANDLIEAQGARRKVAAK